MQTSPGNFFIPANNIPNLQIHISNYAISVGFPVEEASRVASLMMIGLVAGKILLGFVNDRLGGLATLGAAVILVLAAVGIANMWLAVFGDVGVAVLAILNAMRAMGVSKLRD